MEPDIEAVSKTYRRAMAEAVMDVDPHQIDDDRLGVLGDLRTYEGFCRRFNFALVSVAAPDGHIETKFIIKPADKGADSYFRLVAAAMPARLASNGVLVGESHQFEFRAKPR